MRFHSAVNEHVDASTAVSRAVAETRAALGDAVDVAFVFFTADHRDDAEAVVERVWRGLDPQVVIGCSAEGVIGGDAEIERRPGLALLAGSLVRRAAPAIALPGAILIAMYVVNALAGLAKSLEPLRPLSVFDHYGSAIERGIAWGGFVAVALLGVAFAALAAVAFARRDIYT